MSRANAKKPALNEVADVPQRPLTLPQLAEQGAYVAVPAALLLRGITEAVKVTGLPDGWSAVDWVRFWDAEIPRQLQVVAVKEPEAEK